MWFGLNHWLQVMTNYETKLWQHIKVDITNVTKSKNQNKSLVVWIIQAFTASVLATSLTPSSSENEWFVERVKRHRWLQHRENHGEDGDCAGGARRRLGTAGTAHSANQYGTICSGCRSSCRKSLRVSRQFVPNQSIICPKSSPLLRGNVIKSMPLCRLRC